MSRTFFRDTVAVIVLTGLASVPRLVLLHLKSFEIFHADHAVIGLMARHILLGKPMVYVYGQGYMGSLESFMAALIYLFKGMNIVSIQLAPFVFFLLFIIVNYYLLKQAFGFQVALTANLLLAVPSPHLSLLSVTALGGYPETLFFGSLILLGLIRYRESRRNAWILFLSGLAAGIGFWVNNLILFYFLAVGAFWVLRSDFFKGLLSPPGWRKILFLDGVKMSFFFRGVILTVHAAIFLFLFWQIVSFLLGPTEFAFGDFRFQTASPPFLVKKMKKLLYLLLAEITAFSLWNAGIRKICSNLKPFLPLAGGAFWGTLPVFLNSILGGEGYRVIHGSGTIFAKEIPQRFTAVIGQGLAQGIWGVPLEVLLKAEGLRYLWGWSLLILSVGLTAYYVFLYRKDLVKLIRLRQAHYPYAIFPFLLALIVLCVCFFSTLEAWRYLLPLSLAFSVIFALALSQMQNKIWAASILLFLMTNQAYGHFDFIRRLPNFSTLKQGHDKVLRFLEEREIRGAYAHYVHSYVLTFESQEKIIVAPYRSHDRYPAYTQYVDKLDRVAYIFQQEDSLSEGFQKQLDKNRVSYERVWLGPFWVFVINRRNGSEKGRI